MRLDKNSIISILNDDTTDDIGFIKALNYTIEMENIEDSTSISCYYKPSSMRCIRQMFYIRNNTTFQNKKDSSVLVGICEVGTHRHNDLQNYIAKMKKYSFKCEYLDVGLFIKDNKRLSKYIDVISKEGNETKLFDKRYNMSFMCDGLIEYNNELYILEIKTEGTNKFYYRDRVAEEHIDQATCYSLAFGINKVLFLYENRDMLDKKCFILEVTDKDISLMKKKIKDCERFVVSGVLPSGVYNSRNKSCVYCNYVDLCKQNRIGN